MINNTNVFPLFPSSCTSQLAKHLSPEIYEQLKDLKTKNGFRLSDAIASGVENLDSGIGVYAGDEESYSLFSPLFDPIIKEYHGFGATDRHHSDLNVDALIDCDVDPKGEYILSTRIRVGRNLADFPLGPAITTSQRAEVEERVSSALGKLEGELEGVYHPLLGMDEETSKSLIKDHFLFKVGDRFLESAGLNRDWPHSRGIYHNNEKTFLVWINEEDQLRIISMQKGGDIKKVFSRLVSAIKEIEKRIKFLYNDHLGYISSCPTNLGTAMRASVHIKLPKLSSDMKLFESIAAQYHLQIRGINGEHSESEGAVYDLSNRRRLGVSEVQCVQDMIDGVRAMIAREKSL